MAPSALRWINGASRWSIIGLTLAGVLWTSAGRLATIEARIASIEQRLQRIEAKIDEALSKERAQRPLLHRLPKPPREPLEI